jgi:hypothetical protein
MALPNNILQTVQTYQDSQLAYLINSFAIINNANKKFQNFQNLEANLGDTVTFDLPPRYTTTNSLVATFQESQQRVQNLTVDQSINTAYAFSAQQFIFNVREYMEKFGKSAVTEIGSNIESQVARNCIENHTYRFYGDGVTAINSFGQLATAMAYFRDYGAVKDQAKAFLPMTQVPAIVNSGLNQFVMDRNEDIANSWQLGDFAQTSWYQSNLLPLHVSGSVGNGASAAVQTLTVVSTNDPTGANITQITCTCDGSLSGDINAIKAGDVGYFLDGVAGQPNLRYLTFIGHKPSQNSVQIRATVDAVASGTTVVLTVSPALVAVANQNQNITNNIVAGMKIKMMPSHRAGLIMAGNPLFLAMPQLPEEVPFPTANKTDPDSGVAMRLYYGSLFGQNQRGFVNDAIWGSTLVDEYAMRILFPA